MRRVALACGLLALICSCRSGPGDTWTPDWRWSEREPHEALVDGAWTREREIANMSPALVEVFVGADWRARHARTEQHIVPLLRPVVDERGALAVLALAHDVQVHSEHWSVMRHSVPLEYDPTCDASSSCMEQYGPSDAARWRIGDRPDVRVRDDRVEVRRPVWRALRDDEREPKPPQDAKSPTWLMLQVPGQVEYVVDVVYRNGTIRRSVERVLESGVAARRHGPVPLM